MKSFKKLSERLLFTALCAGSLLSLSNSCTELDESSLVSRLEELEEKVTNLETNLTNEISTLKALVEGKLTVISCAPNSDGSAYTIVFSDNNTITVAAAGSSTGSTAGSSAAAGLVGVMEEDGVYYWTIGDKPLLSDDEKVAVSDDAVPMFQINKDSKEWEVSVDGLNWISTGISMEEGSTTLISFMYEDDDFVYLTLADGSDFKVAKYTDFACSILSGKQYFSYGESKTVRLSLANIAKTNIVKPDGWRASISGSNLEITAPAEENTYAEQSGKVLVIATSTEGEISVQEISVEVGITPVTISVSDDGSVVFALHESLVDNWDYLGYYYGAMLADEFSPEAVLAQLENNTMLNPTYYSTETSIENLTGSFDREENYVVWTIPAVEYGGELNVDEITFETLVSVSATILEANVTFEDADITVTLKGATTFYGGIMEDPTYFNAESIVGDINDGWTWGYTKMTGSYSGKLSAYGAEYGGSNYLTPGATYVVWALPIVDGKTYTADDVVYIEVGIPDFTTGGTAAVTIGEVTSTITSVSAQITPGDGTYVYYVTYMSAESYNGTYNNDELRLERVLEAGTQYTMLEGFEWSNTSLSPASNGYILAVAVDKNGQAGPLACVEANTPDFTYSDVTISAVLDEVGLNTASVVLSGTGITKFYYQVQTESSWKSYPYQGSLEEAQKALALKASGSYNYQIKEAEATDGSYTLELSGNDAATGTKYHLSVIGVDENNLPTKAVELEYEPGIDANIFVATSDELYTSKAADFPVVSNIKVDGTAIEELTEFASGYKDVTFDVKAGTSCAKMWVYFAGSTDYIDGISERSKTGAVIANATEYEGNTAPVSDGMFSQGYIYITWQDTDGKIYSYTMLDVSTLLGTANAAE